MHVKCKSSVCGVSFDVVNIGSLKPIKYLQAIYGCSVFINEFLIEL